MGKVSSSGDKVAFTQDVLIEDTDCFGVVYNANYLKFFDRARQDAPGVQQVRLRMHCVCHLTCTCASGARK